MVVKYKAFCEIFKYIQWQSENNLLLFDFININNKQKLNLAQYNDIWFTAGYSVEMQNKQMT